ncbi:TetR/AcrR family transcriptional regulator [Nonomuraea guangzhouensis]|uniref:TetR/AcrR family transcriptional regulator n=1 Tax=Nonomuraea guangzhouensis TaxID=1291555 RepID=A0ABW4GIL5_9ACTN|nr:TetR family transcriptional regulator [Nonomuraea guangzhouensis]
MADETRRERKKLQTRQLLVDTALRLFAEQGYEQTTIAQITQAADVAKKTFFNHFPTKEDVLFADTGQYVQAAVEVIGERAPEAPVSDVLLEIYERVFARRLAEEPIAGAGKHLDDSVMKLPAVQAKALHVMFDLQQAIADALLKAYPRVLDPVTAAAAVGSLMGAAQAAGTVSLRERPSMEEYLTSIRRAIDVALQGLRSL